jgi:hypothetical protein
MTSDKCHKLQEGYFSVKGRFCADSYLEKSDPKLPSGRLSKASGRSSISNICLDDVAIPSGRPSVSRNFKLFKVASVRTYGKSSGRSSEFKKNPVSGRTTWQYRPDAIQCSTSNRVFVSDTDMGRQLQPSRRCVFPSEH